jgi:ubiquinone/menaquinone biosynthesis C-methylase UbiE
MLPQCNLYGLDVSKPAIEQGKNYIHGKAKLEVNDGLKIPFSDNFFDVSFTAAVMESIPEPDFSNICNELIRVTKKTIIHVEASRKYPTKYPHSYYSFYKNKGHHVTIFKMDDYDHEFNWYQITVNPFRKNSPQI